MNNKVFIVLGLLLSSSLMTACGDNNKSKQVAKIQAPVQEFKNEVSLGGKVSNDDGFIKTGKIEVTDSKKHRIAETSVQENGQYEVLIPKGTKLPIILTFQPEKEDKKLTKMVSVVVYSSMTRYDINPLTTKIAKKAKELGGYTASNMVLAAESTVHVPDENKTTTGFRGDPTSQYGGWH